eukprot:gene11310-2059_t
MGPVIPRRSSLAHHVYWAPVVSATLHRNTAIAQAGIRPDGPQVVRLYRQLLKAAAGPSAHFRAAEPLPEELAEIATQMIQRTPPPRLRWSHALCLQLCWQAHLHDGFSSLLVLEALRTPTLASEFPTQRDWTCEPTSAKHILRSMFA